MREESPLIKKIQSKPEQNTCSCGCTDQDNLNFKKTEQRPIVQLQSDTNK